MQVMDDFSDRRPAHVLVLPGGRPVGTTPARPWHPPQVRMRLFAGALRGRLRKYGIAVDLVDYRYRGWNEDHMSPVRDGLRAIESVVRRRGDVRIGLVGHAMGARAVAHLAGQHGVESLVALAPWWPTDDADLIPAGRHLLVAHGTEDTRTDPRAAQSQVMAAGQRGVHARWRPLPGGGHFLLADPHWWADTTADFLTCTLSGKPTTCPGDDHAS